MARNQQTTTTYQAFDTPDDAAPISLSEPGGVTTTISRDIFGKPATLTRSGTYTPPSGGAQYLSLVRSYVYDPQQRLCKTIEPETGSTVFNYDADGNLLWSASGLSLTSTTDCQRTNVAAAQKTSYDYDARNRRISTTYGDGSPSIGTTYTPDGLPWTVTSDGSTWTYGYNKRRLLQSEVLALGTESFPIGHTYDALGHENTLTYPDGMTIDSLPNAFGEPTRARNVGTGVNYASSVTRHPNGAIAAFAYGNGVQHTLTQTTRGLPNVSRDRLGSTDILNDDYDWDPNGNVLKIASSIAVGATRTMTYDARDRLATTSYDKLGPASVAFTYDPLDNLRRYATPYRDYTHEYDAANRLMRIRDPANQTMYTYGYAGAAGNRGVVTQRNQASGFDVQNYTVGLDDRVRTLGGTSSATYRYDGMGRRTAIKGADNIERGQIYSQSGQFLVRITCLPTSRSCDGRTDDDATYYIYLGHHLIARLWRGTPTYLHTDGLGSPVAETNASGSVIANSRSLHEPYGLLVYGPTTQGPGYTGHVRDELTGLSYMQQRYYDTIAGRFISPDPMATDPNSGANFNRYWYANNNPYKNVDPDGRQALPPQAMQQALQSIANKNVVLSAGVGATLGIPIAGNSVASPSVGVTTSLSASFTIPDGQIALNASITPFAGFGGGAIINGEVSAGVAGAPLSTGISESVTTFMSASPTKGVDFGAAYTKSDIGDSATVAMKGGIGAYLGGGTGPTTTATAASPPLLVEKKELDK